MQTGGKRGAYRKGIERRQEILDKTVRVFAERGGDRTSLRAIGEEIGISHGTILHYFPSLEVLLLEVLAQRDRENAAELERRGAATLREELTLSAQMNVETPGHVELYTRMLSGAMGSAESPSAEFFRARFEHGRGAFARVIQARAEGAGASAHDSELLAAIVVATFDGLQTQWLLDPSLDIEAALALLASLIGGDGEGSSGAAGALLPVLRELAAGEGSTEL